MRFDATFHCGVNSAWHWVLSALVALSVGFAPICLWAGEEPADDKGKKEAGGDKKEVPDARRSPHATMLTFIASMVEYRKTGDEGKLAEAVACMDLAGAGIEKDLSKRYAEYLKDVIDRFWYYDADDVIPDPYEGGRYQTVRTRPGKSVTFTVVITRQPSGEWLFDKGLVAGLEDLHGKVIGWTEVSKKIQDQARTISAWLRNKMPEGLRQTTFFLMYYQWIGLLILIAVGFILDQIVGTVVRIVLLNWLKKQNVELEEREGKKLERPFGLAAMATLWWFGLYWLGLPTFAHQVLAKIALFFMTFSVVWAAYRMVDMLAAYLSKLAEGTASKMDDLLVPLVRKTLKIFVVVFGLVFIANNLGLPVATVLAGLGIGGVAFAFAAKDTVENLFGSLTALLDRPFSIGDWVVVGNIEGTVEELGFRSTRIRTFYNSLVTVPNALFVRATVDNYGARVKRRIKCTVGVTYDTPPEKIEAFCQGIRELVIKHPYTRKDYFHVYLNSFGPSSLDILLYIFVETPDWATELRERERLFLDIIRLAAELGVEFAYPTQTLHIGSHVTQAPAPVPPDREIDGLTEVVDAKRVGGEVAATLAARQFGPGGTVPAPVEFSYVSDRPGDKAGSADEGEG